MAEGQVMFALGIYQKPPDASTDFGVATWNHGLSDEELIVVSRTTGDRTAVLNTSGMKI